MIFVLYISFLIVINGYNHYQLYANLSISVVQSVTLIVKFAYITFSLLKH